ncbi:type II toxin-antitoxin system HipA family toxin [Massilia rubra]|uniref:Type II toxin-antitoxin system HipA family toxin n=1 Tax=Massilia rubra TaxID=2607910 RepID=A0ABX0LQL7_9BURK|nr:type II toxin-antitoxin system HipA family toxin [Massilia rubra]NHZ37153.1 type II toxin-antitoxin system HipA family toxin [Massilia rubra]
MQKLQVQFCGWGQSWPLGYIASDGRQVVFEYSPEARAKGVELSPIRMPLSVDSYRDFPREQLQLPGLLADALPDGWGLLLMDRFFKKHFQKRAHEISALDRLAFIGSRALGALSFSPATDIALTPQDVKLVDLAKEIQLVVADKDTAALKQLILLGGSPHGARPKVLVQYDATSGIISTLEDGPGTPWLVKFPGQDEHKEVCAIEHAYSETARDCGLDVPATRHFVLGPKTAAFGIERFDRADAMKVPVHTLAGALNLNFRLPNTGYETLLRTTRALTLSEPEVLKAYERCVFNVVFNNRDDHTKNFSFRMDESLTWALAPCYDLTYCHGPAGHHQMDVDGESLHPAKVHLLKLAERNGIALERARSAIERIVSIALTFDRVLADYPMRKATRAAIASTVAANCARMV